MSPSELVTMMTHLVPLMSGSSGQLLPCSDGLQTSMSPIHREAVDRASIDVTAGFCSTLGDMYSVVGSVFFKGSLPAISALLKKPWRLKRHAVSYLCLLFELIPSTWLQSCTLCIGLFYCQLQVPRSLPQCGSKLELTKDAAARDLRERSETAAIMP